MLQIQVQWCSPFIGSIGIDHVVWFVCLFVCFVALRPKSTAMVVAGRSVHLTTLFPGHDHEIISTVILLPSAESFKKGFVSYK